jgi:hypothetical protein
MQVYLIKSGESRNGNKLSHDDHGEFFLHEGDAETRVKELKEIVNADFHVVKAELIETNDKYGTTIAIVDTWETADVYEKAEEMDVEINNIQAGEVLDHISRHTDNEYGMNWDAVENAIREIVKN